MMQPGTLGEWTGERWAPINDDEFTRRVNQILATHMAAAAADPNLGDTAALHLRGVGPQELEPALRAASVALAGYLLQRVTEQDES